MKICDLCAANGESHIRDSQGNIIPAVAGWHVLCGTIHCNNIIYVNACTAHAFMFKDTHRFMRDIIMRDKCPQRHPIDEVVIRKMK